MGNWGYNTYSGWWQLKYFLFPTPIPGEKIPILTHIFSDGLVQPPTTKKNTKKNPTFTYIYHTNPTNIPFDYLTIIFQMGWFNHQPVTIVFVPKTQES